MINKPKNRTIDPGERVKGVMSGWQTYSTTPDKVPTHLKEIVSGAEIVDRLRNLESIINPRTLDLIFRTLDNHIKDKNNPHAVDLKQFIAGIMELLYSIYLENGYSGTFAYFKQEFFRFFKIATVSDMVDGVDPDALVTLDVIRNFIKHHNEDRFAHKKMFENLTPGVPPRVQPTFSISSLVGVPTFFQTPTTGSRWSYIDRDGYLYYSKNEYLPVDYRYGEPLIPIFEDRTNYIRTGNSLDEDYIHLFHTRVSRTNAHGVLRENGIELIEKKDFRPSVHRVVFTELASKEDTPYTFSFYYSPRKAKYLNVKIIETGLVPSEIVYHFDMIKERAELSSVSDISGKNKCELIKLPSGIFFLSVTFMNTTAKMVEVDITLFHDKENIEYKGTQEVLGVFNCFQYENGDGPSPFINTEGKILTRPAIPITVTKESQVTDSHWINEKGGTIVAHFRSPLAFLDEHENTIYQFRIDDRKLLTASQKDNLGAEVVAYDQDSNPIWTQPIKNSDTRLRSVAHAHAAMKQLVAATKVDPILGTLPEIMSYNATHLDVGHQNGTKYLNGYLRKIFYYPAPLNFSQLVFTVN